MTCLSWCSDWAGWHIFFFHQLHQRSSPGMPSAYVTMDINSKAQQSSVLFVHLRREAGSVSYRTLASPIICTLTLPYEWYVTQKKITGFDTLALRIKVIVSHFSRVKVRIVMMMMMMAFPLSRLWACVRCIITTQHQQSSSSSSSSSSLRNDRMSKHGLV